MFDLHIKQCPSMQSFVSLINGQQKIYLDFNEAKFLCRALEGFLCSVNVDINSTDENMGPAPVLNTERDG